MQGEHPAARASTTRLGTGSDRAPADAPDPSFHVRASTVDAVNLATAAAQARIGTWPHEPDVGHLVLTDHEMVPGHDDVRAWLTTARERGLRGVRTGALFPSSTGAFLAAGFVEIDSLRLLRLDLPAEPAGRSRRAMAARRGPTRRLSTSRLAEAATIDERAFGRPWCNDVASLDAIRAATPHHRSRMVVEDGAVAGFAICGRAGTRGYVQRLAVDPPARRRGVARDLVTDGLAWMRRHRVRTALVNTGTGNDAALALYESFDFEPQGELKVLELSFGA